MSSDMTFESKFAQLANNQIMERVPSLIPHRVGFQLIDKNEEETRAFGVAAFVLNKVFLYLPVFFIEGDIKGFDLLYIYQNDLFVPAVDNWIALLEQEGLGALGKAAERDRRATGQFRGPADVDLARFSNMQQKHAGNNVFDREILRDMLLAWPTEELPNLKNDLPKLGKQANECFVATLLQRPEFANALLEWYPKEDIQKLAEQAVADIYAKKGEPKKDEVLFITSDVSEDASALGNAEKKLLMRNGVYVQDNRTNFSKVFQSNVDTSVLQNPTEPGIYDVLLADGVEKTFMIVFPRVLDNPPELRRRHTRNVGQRAALIDIATPKEYYTAPVQQIFCKQSNRLRSKDIEGLRGGDRATKKKLALIIDEEYTDYKSRSLDVMASRNEYLRRRVLLVQSPGVCLETSLERNPGMTEPAFRGTAEWDVYSQPMAYGESPRTGDFYMSEFIPETGKLSTSGTVLMIPEGCRIFVKSREDLALGDLSTVQQALYKQASGFARLTVSFSGQRGTVRFNKQASGLLDRTELLRELVLRHGIHGGTAQKLLKEAAVAKGQIKEFLIKHAAPYDLAAYGDSVAPFMGGPAAVLESTPQYESRQPGGLVLSGAEDAEGVPLLPRKVIERATQASSAGIKEVFDVSVLGGLVDVADMSEIRKDYIAQMVRGMDSVGRMLFLFYWHKDEFEDRYGDLDMKKLESTLKTVFKSTGDLILFLREKTVQRSQFSESMFGTLSEDVGTAALML
jgi:hypothetical protein